MVRRQGQTATDIEQLSKGKKNKINIFKKYLNIFGRNYTNSDHQKTLK